MSDEMAGAVFAAFVVIATYLSVAGIFAAIEISNTKHELQQRGLKEYDKQTGRLIWTEKAGGEKGGDK